MIKTFTYKLYRSKKQRKLDNLVGISNQIFNHCIALHKRYYSLYGKYISKFKLQKHIAKIKKRSYPHWELLGSQAEQNVMDRIDFGYKKFFKKENQRPPKFRPYRKARSFMFKGTVGYKIKDNTIRVNAIETTFKFHKSREIEGSIKTLTIKRDALGEYYIFIACETKTTQEKSIAKTGKSAGFDFGLKMFLTASDESKEKSPEYLMESIDKLRKSSREFSRKKKGSSSRRKAKQELERLHRKIANQRDDFQWKLANTLVSRYDVLCFENLNMKAMQQMWGRKISDLGFAAFMSKIEYLAVKHDKKVLKIGRWEPSSKTCSHCGHKEEEMPLNIRKWTCPNCGTRHDRDVNAAKNILMVGTSTMEGGAVRPALAG